jgi:hypothetical protein
VGFSAKEDRWRSGAAARNHPNGGPRNISAAWFASTRCSQRSLRREESATLSPSSPARAPPGIPHPLGQVLIVTAGCGRAQREGGPVEEIKPGDVVHIAPGEKHWHGAAPTTAMTHIAIVEELNGAYVEWLEKVSDDE